MPVGAVAFGACIIENTLRCQRQDGSPDRAFSLETYEFKEMVDAIRTVERALGEISYEITEKQEASRVFRRSLFTVKDVKKGEDLLGKTSVPFGLNMGCLTSFAWPS